MNSLPLGTTEVYDHTLEIPAAVRMKHVALFGKSGVGKTTLLHNMIVSDIQAGLGVTVLDPHGSLIQALLERIPRHRTNDVIYFNPRNQQHAISINILKPQPTLQQQALVVSYLASIFKKIWKDSWLARSDDILRKCAFALMEQPTPVSLAAVPKLLTDSNYRETILQHVSNPVVRRWFENYNTLDKRFREEIIAAPLNKIDAFITNPLLRAIICQPRSSFDFRWLMDSGKILLCDLSKGALGEDVSSLLGSLIVTKLSLAALSREDIPEEQRRLHVLYCDEVQNFIYGVDLATILAEARKYCLSLTIATQTITQLPPDSRAAVFGNCATIIAFRVGGEDALRLEREFALAIPARELQDLADFKAYLQTMIDGFPGQPSKLKTFPPLKPLGNETKKARVIRTSLARYGRPRTEVEKKINRFLLR